MAEVSCSGVREDTREGLFLALMMDTDAPLRSATFIPPAIAQGEGMMGGVVKGEMKEDLELGCSGDERME